MNSPNYNFMTIEQLVDLVQMDLTVSGLFEKVLPDREIKRIIQEHALEWFYKNYQFSVQKIYYYMAKECFTNDLYTQYKYFIMPEEIENVIDIYMISDPSLFRLGIQAPHLSINLGVTNQPFLTSFVTTVGDLGVYRSVISAFSDEINKMAKTTLKHNFNPVNKRLHILTEITPPSVMIECYVRVQPEEMFGLQLFKDYVIALSRMRFADVLNRNVMPMPGGFNFQADAMLTSGKELLEKTETTIKGQSQVSWFFIHR